MAEGMRVIPICFRSLLDDITKALLFVEPVYQCFSGYPDCGSVLVRTKDSSLVYVYHGGRRENLDVSYEEAVELAVLKLVKTFNIRVVDMNWPEVCELEDQKRYFELQRKWLTRFEKKMVNVIPHHQEWRGVDTRLCGVSINFVQTLNVIVTHLSVLVSPFICMQLDVNDFVCMIGIHCSWPPYGVKWVAGSVCRTEEGSKQDAARKVIDTMKKMFRFEVKDVSFLFLQRLRLDLQLVAESCCTLRDRVLVYEEHMKAAQFIQEHEILSVEELNDMLPFV